MFLLKIKHWQLFTLTWGAGFLLNILSIASVKLFMYSIPVVILLFITGTFGWIWSISTNLNKQLPQEGNLKLGLFKVLFSIPIVYIMFIVIAVFPTIYHKPNFTETGIAVAIGLMIFFHLASMFCIFYGIRFAAKTMKSVELQREAYFSEYLGEFFLIWFSIIGIWIIQPKLNALARQLPE
jgi:hypothetical protein